MKKQKQKLKFFKRIGFLILTILLIGCSDIVSTAPNTISVSNRIDPTPSILSTTPIIPTNISTPSSQAKCPITTTPGVPISPDFGKAFGQGPVYVVFGSDGFQTGVPVYYGNTGNGKKAIKTLWIANSSYKGSINIKGRQLLMCA